MEFKERPIAVFTLSAKGRQHFNDILIDLPKEKTLKVILLFTETEAIRTCGDSIMWVWGVFDRKLHDRGIKIFWNEVIPHLQRSEYLFLRSQDSETCQEYGAYHHNPFNLKLKTTTSITYEEAV